jgi:hypothetical protein
MRGYEHSLFLSSQNATSAWWQLLLGFKHFNCFCKSPNFHTLFKIRIIWLLLYLNVLFEPLACVQKSVFHKRAIVLSQGPWKSATKRSQCDSSTLVIMYTTCFKSKKLCIVPTGFICMLCMSFEINVDYFPKKLVSHAETRVQSQHCLCEFCGGQSGTVTGSFPSAWISFCQLLFHQCHQSSKPHTMSLLAPWAPRDRLTPMQEYTKEQH